MIIFYNFLDDPEYDSFEQTSHLGNQLLFSLDLILWILWYCEQ